jgi:hypothetical protein
VDLARGKTLLQAGHFEQAKVAIDRFQTRATTKLEAQNRAALARLAGVADKEADP